MYQQRERYNIVSVITLGLAILIGFIAILKLSFLLVLFSILLIAISIICDALLLNISFQKFEGLKQLARGVILIFLIIFLFVFYVKGL